jgi:hypothetical protein
LLLGDVFAAAGRSDEARQHWQRVREAREGPLLKAALVAAAERRLGSRSRTALASRRSKTRWAAAENVVAQGQTPDRRDRVRVGPDAARLGREQDAASI